MKIGWPRVLVNRQSKDEAVIAALLQLAAIIEKRNIPVVMDDWDAGYDLAIDEVLALINDAVNQIASENDVDYSGGL
jgi:hypothetical protein